MDEKSFERNCSVLRDLFSYAYNNLTHRKLRSYLTVLGIIVGIASIVVLISIAQGLDESIRAQLARFGSNYLVIIPGSLGGSSSIIPTSFKGVLYEKDAEAIRLIDGVEDVSAAIGIMGAAVEFKGVGITGSVRGVEQGYGRYISSKANFSSGSFFKEGDGGSVVIGHKVANDYFDKPVRAGETLLIEGRKFRVSGVIEKAGQGVDFDSSIFVSLDAARSMRGEGIEKGRVSMIFTLVNEGEDVAQVASRVEQKLLDRHHVSLEDKDFTIITATSVLEQISMITSLLSLFLGGIAAISLLVGGIGIANTMMTAVMERTREIGILKAIGACNSSVLQLFLLESCLIGLVGGVAGALVGLVISFALGAFGVPSKVSIELLAFVILFSLAVGGISGFLPARRAAKLQPLEALRYE
ncbi:ABC transporter permease [Candidatus Micrarchaeota archaeon]|nr:ABC transporter permease [Candidatus Micrarchaeota archaeon]